MKIMLISENPAVKIKFENLFRRYPEDWTLALCEKDNAIDGFCRQHFDLLCLDDAVFPVTAEKLTFFQQRNPALQIIVLTDKLEMDSIKEYLRLGADSCLHVDIAERDLFLKLIVCQNGVRCKTQLHQVNQNYTDLKNVQTQLVQAEKLAGIGRLAAGIAHEINNPLGFVSGNIEVLGKYIARYEIILDMVKNAHVFSDEACIKTCGDIAEYWQAKRLTRIRNDMRSLFDDTKDGLSRISNIVTGLKNFSRINQQNEKGLFDLNEGIRTTLIVARNELKYNCEVEFREGVIPAIHVNGGQLNQVILNMLINAAHAIKEKFSNEKGMIHVSTFEEDGFVCCRIQDNGCGMEEETVKHIFEPFFTTKAVGVGTGLGLGIAYDIIYNKHGGKISVTSVYGEGSCFTLSLPATGNESAEPCTIA